jgi:type I phosphodiesterase/nucleotide pyrophosphatase
MRYLRMLSNSVFAGLLASAYLTLLLLHLNPSVPLTTSAVGPLLAVLTVSYGLHIAVVSYALYVIRQIAIVEPSPPGWISLRLLTWSASVLSGTAAVITWLHASGLQTALDSRALPGIVYAATAFALATLVFLVLGFAQIAARPDHRATVAILFSIATITSIAVPLWLRAGILTARADSFVRSSIDPESLSGARIVLLCLDGASLDVISPAVAAGRLPNFGRLLDRGASMHLATTRPTQPEPVWASVMTGMWPAHHGVRGAARYRPFNGNVAVDVLPDYLFSQALLRLGLLIEEPYSAASLESRPLWQIVERYGVPSGLIGLPLTHPADVSAGALATADSRVGFIVSDRFHRRNDSAAVLDTRPAISPARIDDAARAALAAEQRQSALENRIGLELLPRTGESSATVDADRLHHLLARQLASAEPVRLLAVRYAGLDAVGHYYLRYANPDAYGDVSEAERRRFGRVLDDYYGYVDSLVGDALASLGDDDLLVVVSGFGMEPLPFGKRLLERIIGDARFTGTHERAPDGFLLAYGAAVAPARQSRGAVVDVAPTLLYFLGLPVARDMDGFVRTDLFTRAFNEERTITFIPSYRVP